MNEREQVLFEQVYVPAFMQKCAERGIRFSDEAQLNQALEITRSLLEKRAIFLSTGVGAGIGALVDPEDSLRGAIRGAGRGAGLDAGVRAGGLLGGLGGVGAMHVLKENRRVAGMAALLSVILGTGAGGYAGYRIGGSLADHLAGVNKPEAKQAGAKEVAELVAGKIKEVYGKAKGKVKDIAGKVKTRATNAAEDAANYARHYPAETAVAGGLGAGALAGGGYLAGKHLGKKKKQEEED